MPRTKPPIEDVWKSALIYAKAYTNIDPEDFAQEAALKYLESNRYCHRRTHADIYRERYGRKGQKREIYDAAPLEEAISPYIDLVPTVVDIGRLNPKQRETAMLLLKGYCQREIANLLGKTEAAIHLRILGLRAGQ